MNESYEMAGREQLVGHLFKLRNTPYQKYLGLKPHDQEILRNHICKIRPASFAQLIALDEKIRSSDIVMGRIIDQNNLRSPEALEHFYSLSKNEIDAYWSKF